MSMAQSRSTAIESELLYTGRYVLDLKVATRADLQAIRRLWEQGIIQRIGEPRTDSIVMFSMGPKLQGS